MSELVNPVSGKLKKLSEGEFLDLFDPEVHNAILASAAKPADVEGIVCFETLDLGLVCRNGPGRTALVVGPSNTFTLEQAAVGHLGDVPSRFKYPTAYVDYRKP